MIIWANFFDLIIFTTVPSSVYSAIIIQYNSYQEFKFKLLYINGTSFGKVNQWGTPAATPAFTTSLYIPLQVITFTPIYTMELNSSFGKIQKFRGRPGSITLREFKVTFSTMVHELEFKYGVNYIKVFAFKQLACYVHYEALDVYEQHSSRILGVTQIPNPAYATAIATTSQTTLQAAIAHHRTMPNNPNPVPTLVIFSPQQFFVIVANIPPTINPLDFVDPMGEFFRILELEFSINSSKNNFAARHLLLAKGWNLQDALQEASQA